MLFQDYLFSLKFEYILPMLKGILGVEFQEFYSSNNSSSYKFLFSSNKDKNLSFININNNENFFLKTILTSINDNKITCYLRILYSLDDDDENQKNKNIDNNNLISLFNGNSDLDKIYTINYNGLLGFDENVNTVISKFKSGDNFHSINVLTNKFMLKI